MQGVPFTLFTVNRHWARNSEPLVKQFVVAWLESVAWYNDPANRDAAVRILADAAKVQRQTRLRATIFFRRSAFFARDAVVDPAAGSEREKAPRFRGARSLRRVELVGTSSKPRREELPTQAIADNGYHSTAWLREQEMPLAPPNPRVRGLFL